MRLDINVSKAESTISRVFVSVSKFGHGPTRSRRDIFSASHELCGKFSS